MAVIQRPVKQGNATTYQGKVSLGFDDILAPEVDADLDTIYAAWNGGADTANIANNSVTAAKIAPNQIGPRELVDDLPGSILGLNTIGARELADDLPATILAAGSVGERELTDNLPGAILAGDTIGVRELANDLPATILGPGSISDRELSPGCVILGKIGSGAVRGSNGPGLPTNEIVQKTIHGHADIGDGTITKSEFQPGASVRTLGSSFVNTATIGASADTDLAAVTLTLSGGVVLIFATVSGRFRSDTQAEAWMGIRLKRDATVLNDWVVSSTSLAAVNVPITLTGIWAEAPPAGPVRYVVSVITGPYPFVEFRNNTPFASGKAGALFCVEFA